MTRKGMMVGSGKQGYHNVVGRDSAVHSQSAKGIKQPQRINTFNVPNSNHTEALKDYDDYLKKVKDKREQKTAQKDIFDIKNIVEKNNYIKNNINSPYINSYYSTLGGDDSVSILFTISLDPKDKWENDILENSRYGKFHLQKNGSLEQHSGSFSSKDVKVKYMRKTKVNSVEKAVEKINEYLNQVRHQQKYKEIKGKNIDGTDNYMYVLR